MRLNIDADGNRIVARELMRMAGRSVDASPAMDAVIEGLYASNRKQFDSEGKHGSGGWKKPSDDWIAEKSRRGLDSRTEQATLELRESLTERGGANFAIARSDGVQFGTTVPQAKWAKARGNVLVQPTEGERRGFVKIVQRWVIEGDRAASGLLSQVM